MTRLRLGRHAPQRLEVSILLEQCHATHATMDHGVDLPAQRQGVPPDRISFIDALDVLCSCDPIVAARLKLTVNPHRPDRDEPRVIKRKKDRYTYMTRPRDELHQALGITRPNA